MFLIFFSSQRRKIIKTISPIVFKHFYICQAKHYDNFYLIILNLLATLLLFSNTFSLLHSVLNSFATIYIYMYLF